MSNADALAQLDKMIETIATLPEELQRTSVPLIRDQLRADINANVKAGLDPEGKAWEKTEEGEKPLKNAAAAVDVRSSGTAIIVELTGPEVKHHKGTARGKKKRRIIPTRGLPVGMSNAIKRVVGRNFQRLAAGK